MRNKHAIDCNTFLHCRKALYRLARQTHKFLFHARNFDVRYRRCLHGRRNRGCRGSMSPAFAANIYWARRLRLMYSQNVIKRGTIKKFYASSTRRIVLYPTLKMVAPPAVASSPYRPGLSRIMH